jgi:hypothetical protein
MATGQGTAIIDFGSAPGLCETSVVVTGLTTISATSKAEAFIMADDTTATHTASDHRYATAFIGLTCGTPTAGTGFTIYARSIDQLQGQFAVRFVWAD